MKKLDTTDLSTDELEAKLKELKDELFHLRFKFAIGQLEDHAKITRTKRDVARCLTALTAAAKAAPAEASA